MEITRTRTTNIPTNPGDAITHAWQFEYIDPEGTPHYFDTGAQAVAYAREVWDELQIGDKGTLQTVHGSILYGAEVIEIATESERGGYVRIAQNYSTGRETQTIALSNVRRWELTA